MTGWRPSRTDGDCDLGFSARTRHALAPSSGSLARRLPDCISSCQLELLGFVCGPVGCLRTPTSSPLRLAISSTTFYPMPPKGIVKDRAWGTRYDTLGSSPPASPPLLRVSTEHLNTSIASPPHGALKQPPSTPDKTGAQDGTPHDSSIFVGRYVPHHALTDSSMCSSRICTLC